MRRQRCPFLIQPREPHGRNPVQDLKELKTRQHQRRRTVELRFGGV